ncbi:MAG: hypothetical protein CMH81_05940 [Nitrospiraceae bacterium]|nr:hypothetical protein [Nitrospiraceae bacterium]|tara:strand:- start:289 stop:1818 length:1530 start_codon:yes stop_codon:yes gene_type:complete
MAEAGSGKTRMTTHDIGLEFERHLTQRSQQLFGILQPLEAPASDAEFVPRAAAIASQRVKLAKGLQAEFVARNIASMGDMITFWPTVDHPSHLLICIEQKRSGVTPRGHNGANSSVQRVTLSDGMVETILYGMHQCDGIRTTGWGTVLVTEEADDGRAYEIIDLLNTTGHWIADRTMGDIRKAIDSEQISSMVVQRVALPTLAWEGFTVLPSGVIIFGDELRPGSGSLDTDGGSIFKFIPTHPRVDKRPIATLEDSPLISGSTYALTVSCVEVAHSNFPQFGQGCEVGVGTWVNVAARTARQDANRNGGTGYYRPEDLHRDPTYIGKGVRFCWANTGRLNAGHYGEIICGVDHVPYSDTSTHFTDLRTGFRYLASGGMSKESVSTVTINRFAEGDRRFNAHDNIAFQPITGTMYVTEDAKFGEVFACLPDGRDRDLKSDGCVSVLSVADPHAEPTGFIFDATGKAAYVLIQHGEQAMSLLDMTSNRITGYTDDLIKITGFEIAIYRFAD